MSYLSKTGVDSCGIGLALSRLLEVGRIVDGYQYDTELPWHAKHFPSLGSFMLVRVLRYFVHELVLTRYARNPTIFLRKILEL